MFRSLGRFDVGFNLGVNNLIYNFNGFLLLAFLVDVQLEMRPQLQMRDGAEVALTGWRRREVMS